jgi:N-acetylglucosaminyl-diphospho-decaprenol L-rhamnosyltransferase
VLVPSNRPSPVAVVIITRDRTDELLHTLARLHELDERPQIVVVDQGARHRAARAVSRRFPAVRIVALAEDIGAAGRNVGARAVDAPYVAFCDDDSWWARGALTRAAALLDAHPRVAVIAARVLLGDDEVLDPACAAMSTSPLEGAAGLPGRRVLGFVACGAIVRRTAFLEAGGFRRELGVGGEEQLLAVDLATRGWDLVYRGDVVAHHHPSPIRNRERRDEQHVRNQLWFAWLRRRHGAALRISREAVRAAATQRAARIGLLRALSGARWALANRRPVSASLEGDLRRLDTERSALGTVQRAQ